ncbi:MAG: hypothetical protein WHV66_07080 [Anaerolineales bacterium]|jgi:Ca2+-binding RTX toxin-like protein
MNRRLPSKTIFLAILPILAIFSIGSAVAAANDLPVSWLRHFRETITPNSLKPPACAGLNLTSLAAGSGTINGSNSADLILGSAGNDTLYGRAGDDCLVGGAGDDWLYGGAGQDILIGGDGFDTCDGGGGNDTFDSSCEVQIR